MKNKKVNPVFSILAGIVFFILLVVVDQWTKKLAVLHLKDQDPVILIPNVFQLYYLENRGASFGIMQGKSIIFIIISFVILALIVYFYGKIPFYSKYRILRVFMVLISAGAVGNLIDRVTQQYVVDFFYFNLINFPIFNVADIYLTCTIVLLIIYILFRFNDEYINEILVHLGWKKNHSDTKEE